jgi:uncharacterized protein YcnI
MTPSSASASVRAVVGLGVVALATVGVQVLATPAAAHVTVSPADATQGERARVDFRVPNESETESTVAVEVHFLEDPPISSVTVGKVPGWRAEITYRELDEPVEGGHGEQITEVVESIAWTAEDPDAEIGPGEFGEFPVGFGPLPHADQLYFPTLQTYSNGEVVRWIEEPQPGVELELPAPSLTLAAASDVPSTDGTGNGNGTAGGEEGGREGGTAQESGSGAGTWLGLAGLVAGLAGLALGGVAFTRTRTRTGES